VFSMPGKDAQGARRGGSVIDPAPLRTHAPRPVPVVLRLPAAARALGVSTRTVRRLIASGHLAASRVGRVLLIEARAIETMLARTRIGAVR
jgi:excisionase family DNA binding protein